ncbi:translocation protein Sec66 [Coemansia sp. RSA 486]|nr:translocation protein Sec66 [Coemansia sp. RSA 486]
MASGTGMLLVYIIGWGIVFGTFVHYYHKRKAQSLSKLESWYPDHPERDIYFSLIKLQKQDPSLVSNEALMAALFRRAMTDIIRMVEVQTNKQALAALVKSGAMSEEYLHQFNASETEKEAELMSVAQEAERLRAGWGRTIFAAASEMVNCSRLRELREEMNKLSFESANCVRSAMLEDMGEEKRNKALKDGTEENKELVKNDVLLSSIYNMPIGEGVKVAAAAQARRQAEERAKAEKEKEAKEKQDKESSGAASPKPTEAKPAAEEEEKPAATDKDKPVASEEEKPVAVDDKPAATEEEKPAVDEDKQAAVEASA